MKNIQRQILQNNNPTVIRSGVSKRRCPHAAFVQGMRLRTES